MRVLVVNAGSSSLKLAVLDDDELVARHDLPAPGGRFDEAAVERVVRQHRDVEAVGHRVVHGGATFEAPVRVDPDVRQQLAGLVDLAPLHLPRSLAGIDVVGRLLPGLPAVACFDTAFHATLPPAARTYALPVKPGQMTETAVALDELDNWKLDKTEWHKREVPTTQTQPAGT